MLLSLLPVFLNILLGALNDFGVDVPPSVGDLIAKTEPVVMQLIAEIRAGGTPSVELVSIMQSLLPAIAAVKADTSLDPKYPEWAGLLDDMVANVTLADADALLGVDPTKLHAE